MRRLLLLVSKLGMFPSLAFPSLILLMLLLQSPMSSSSLRPEDGSKDQAPVCSPTEPACGCMYGLLKQDPIHVGVVVTTTSRSWLPSNISVSSITEIQSLSHPLLRDLAPGLSKVMHEKGFRVSFFVSYDYDDEVFSEEAPREVFNSAWIRATHTKEGIHWVAVNATGLPAVAQATGAMAAYRHGVEYIFRLNDDSHIVQPEHLLSNLTCALQCRSPPNMGIVGPSDRKKGGKYVPRDPTLWNEYVHRSHIDRFGFYYPRQLRVNCADTWMSAVYSPLYFERIKHTVKNAGERRYKTNAQRAKMMARQLARRMKSDIVTPLLTKCDVYQQRQLIARGHKNRHNLVSLRPRPRFPMEK